MDTVIDVGPPLVVASTIFSYVGRSDSVKDILCNLQSDISIRCNLGNPFLRLVVPPRVPIDQLILQFLLNNSKFFLSSRVFLLINSLFLPRNSKFLASNTKFLLINS